MATEPRYKLTDEQITHFMDHGWIRIRQCFSREKSSAWTEDIWTRLGFSLTDKTTWTREITYMTQRKEESVKTFAPKAWSAICELLGGEDRIAQESATWNDAFIVNLGTPQSEGVKTRLEDLQEWHVDGDFFVHFLDSPEQALLVVPLFSDIDRDGGGTAIITDSTKFVALHLHDHKRGVSPNMAPRGWIEKLKFKFRFRKQDYFDSLRLKCKKYDEMIGDTGDVILVHPLMVHSRSVNSLRVPRIITNAPVSLNEPFNFNRSDANYSIVERKTLHDLGRNNLEGWKISGKRRALVPPTQVSE